VLIFIIYEIFQSELESINWEKLDFIHNVKEPRGAFLWDDLVQDQSSKICLDRGASKELMNPFWSWIHWFLWCTMIQTDLGSLILIQITPKECSLDLHVFSSYYNMSGCNCESKLFQQKRVGDPSSRNSWSIACADVFLFFWVVTPGSVYQERTCLVLFS